MERIFIDDRSEYTARASNPATGDVVLVGWDAIRNRMVYRINGGPFQTVARTITPTATKLAMELLYEHIAQCEATDNEELTLP